MANYYELSPAYGRDYKSATEVKAAWEAGKDFEGDYRLGFKPVNKDDIPKPCTVSLRYAGLRRVAVVKVSKAPPRWNLYWSPEGRKIDTVEALTAKEAIRKTPKPYSQYPGEVYAEEVK